MVMSSRKTAAASGLHETQILIDTGADVNALDECRRTPLHVVATKQSSVDAGRVVRTLLANGASLTSRDTNGRTPVPDLLKRCPFDVSVLSAFRGRMTLADRLKVTMKKLFP